MYNVELTQGGQRYPNLSPLTTSQRRNIQRNGFKAGVSHCEQTPHIRFNG